MKAKKKIIKKKIRVKQIKTRTKKREKAKKQTGMHIFLLLLVIIFFYIGLITNFFNDLSKLGEQGFGGLGSSGVNTPEKSKEIVRFGNFVFWSLVEGIILIIIIILVFYMLIKRKHNIKN